MQIKYENVNAGSYVHANILYSSLHTLCYLLHNSQSQFESEIQATQNI